MQARKIADSQLIEELKAGLSQRKIAEKYDMHFMSINRRVAKLRAAGVDLPPSYTQKDPDRKPRTVKRKPNRHHVVERCGKSDCRYISTLGSMLICDYIGFMGRSRGCPPESCTEYRRDGD
ncbi:MAG: hypothetical protein SOR93_06495 [Clostridiales Family XIII bacterium]|nr:hypothetical protein [Clostridia bacterium]MDY3010903.1 hypothetical protein [Clostridiales Family XIII bacterium]